MKYDIELLLFYRGRALYMTVLCMTPPNCLFSLFHVTVLCMTLTSYDCTLCDCTLHDSQKDNNWILYDPYFARLGKVHLISMNVCNYNNILFCLLCHGVAIFKEHGQIITILYKFETTYTTFQDVPSLNTSV